MHSEGEIMSTIIEERVTTQTKLKAPSKYNIWAIDNNLTSFAEVVFILVQSFGMSEGEAAKLTVKVDIEGKAKVNPKPMSKGLAEAQLDKIQNVKRALSQVRSNRASEVMMLKFIIKED